MRLIGIVILIGACSAGDRPPTVSRAFPEMETMMSVAVWGREVDSARIVRATDDVRDTVDRLDSLRPRQRRALVDSLGAALRQDLRLSPDSSSVLRGYALDRAALALTGVADSALLDLGGQYLWIGRPTARQVGIADPANSLRIRAVVEMRDGSVSTSSQLEREPRSLTVLAPTATAAGGWSSALLPLGCDSALTISARLRLSVVCVDSTDVRWTADLKNRVEPRASGAGQVGRGP